MTSTLCKMLALVVFLSIASQPAFADRYYNNEALEYRTQCSQVWNYRYNQVETVCHREYLGYRNDVGPYARDGYCCVDGYRPNPYYGHYAPYPRHRGRYGEFDYRDYRGFDRGYGRTRIQLNFRW